MELCKKKEKNLTPIEKILAHYGDAWVWVGFDPITKIVPAFVVGKRTKANAYRLVEKLYRATDGAIPLFTSDELHHYRDALLRVYGIREEAPKGPHKRTSSEAETQAPSGTQVCSGSQASQQGQSDLHYHESDLWERARGERATADIPGKQGRQHLIRRVEQPDPETTFKETGAKDKWVFQRHQ